MDCPNCASQRTKEQKPRKLRSGIERSAAQPVIAPSMNAQGLHSTFSNIPLISFSSLFSGDYGIS